MTTRTDDIVSKLWSLCHVLRDDGITYHEYVTELTFLVFLKMAKETETESAIPKQYRWDVLKGKEGLEQLNFYKKLLLELGEKGPRRIQDIFAGAGTKLRHAKHLHKLVTDIDALDWYSLEREQLGEMYEGLLERNATETKSGAGQYFTPRPLVESVVSLVKPAASEIVQDPAVGTGGFLIMADRFVKEHTNKLFDLKEQQQVFQRKQAFQGVELVPDTRRLALMNLLLHDIEGNLILGDTLSKIGTDLPKADVILTNPPFGTKTGGGRPTRDDFTFPTSNKQLAFLQHVYRGLKPGGRAAIVVPDNVLFEENVGSDIRADLMDKCDLHTILRLPTGIFYAQGVKTNIMFFTRGKSEKGNTKAVWIYDMRTNAPAFGKRTPLTHEHFADFEKAFGEDPLGKSKRKDQGEEGRFRKFTRDEVAKRGENLDITWLREAGQQSAGDLPAPDEIAAEIIANLTTATREMEALTAALESEKSR